MSRTAIDLFIEALPGALGRTFSEKGSTPWIITLDEQPKPFPAGTQLLTLLLVAEPSKAEAVLQISLESSIFLVAALSGGATVPEQFHPEHEQVVRAALAKACETAAEVLPGIEVKLQLAKTVSWTPVRQVSLTGTDGASGKVQLQLLFTADWPQDGTAADTAPTQALKTEKGVTVSILENVEIDVILQFGERQLPLREIGELRSGSVIELDKYLTDPAELLLAGRVVARGEVVIVDGNYGLRVTEVV
jgi:flagellar motor switch protein FliN/FliY